MELSRLTIINSNLISSAKYQLCVILYLIALVSSSGCAIIDFKTSMVKQGVWVVLLAGNGNLEVGFYFVYSLHIHPNFELEDKWSFGCVNLAIRHGLGLLVLNMVGIICFPVIHLFIPFEYGI